MESKKPSVPSVIEFTHGARLPEMRLHCPTQILVLDDTDGPADILSDMLGRLYECCVSYTLVSHNRDAINALDCYKYDLLLIGLEHKSLDLLALVPDIRKNYPDMPIILTKRTVSAANREQAYALGLDMLIELPRTASSLKALLKLLAEHYLNAAC